MSGRDATNGRDRRRDAQLDRAPGTRDRRLRRDRPALVGDPGRGCSCRSPVATAPSSPGWRGPWPRHRTGSVRRGIEVNISCPNVANRGLVFACDPGSSAEVLSAVRAVVPCGTKLFAKLSPDVTDLVPIAAAALAAGADGLTMINTVLGMAIDTERLRPHLFGVTGDCPPAIRPVAVRAIWQVHAAMRAGSCRRHRSSVSAASGPAAMRSGTRRGRGERHTGRGRRPSTTRGRRAPGPDELTAPARRPGRRPLRRYRRCGARVTT